MKIFLFFLSLSFERRFWMLFYSFNGYGIHHRCPFCPFPAVKYILLFLYLFTFHWLGYYIIIKTTHFYRLSSCSKICVSTILQNDRIMSLFIYKTMLKVKLQLFGVYLMWIIMMFLLKYV